VSIDAFSWHFEEQADPRQAAKITFRLFDVLFLTVCAASAGASGREDIEDFGEAHLHWLKKKGCFPMDCLYTTPSPVSSPGWTPPSFGDALSTGRSQYPRVLRVN